MIDRTAKLSRARRIGRSEWSRSNLTAAETAMTDETHDDAIGLEQISEFADTVSQRAIAFCNVAQLAERAKDEAVRELCLTMMRKLTATIKAPSTADLRLIGEGVR